MKKCLKKPSVGHIKNGSQFEKSVLRNQSRKISTGCWNFRKKKPQVKMIVKFKVSLVYLKTIQFLKIWKHVNSTWDEFTIQNCTWHDVRNFMDLCLCVRLVMASRTLREVKKRTVPVGIFRLWRDRTGTVGCLHGSIPFLHVLYVHTITK